MSDTTKFNEELVSIQRAARFADITPEEWGKRLRALIEAQPTTKGEALVRNVRPVEVAAGGSNGTLLFEATWQTDQGKQARELVLRFLPVNGYFHRYSVTEQFNLQKALGSTTVPVAPQLWIDADGRYLERPGYVMERVEGVSPPMAWRTSGLIADASPEMRRRMSQSYVETQAAIHDADWRELGLQWLENRAEGTRPIERETNWLWHSIEYSEQDEYIRALEPIKDWLIANEPRDIETVLCHGDTNFGNYLFVDGKVSAVLDWEMAFLGAAECDVLFMPTGDLVTHPDDPVPEGFMSYAEMEEEYCRLTGRTLKHRSYFEVFAALRVATTCVLTFKHFPPEVLDRFVSVVRRGPDVCLARARKLGII